MAEHIHAQVLRWIAQGLSKEIECRCEVEAPVLEPGDLRAVWCWDTDYNEPTEYRSGEGTALEQYKFGLCFASREACQSAHDAIHALLRGESC